MCVYKYERLPTIAIDQYIFVAIRQRLENMNESYTLLLRVIKTECAWKNQAYHFVLIATLYHKNNTLVLTYQVFRK